MEESHPHEDLILMGQYTADPDLALRASKKGPVQAQAH